MGGNIKSQAYTLVCLNTTEIALNATVATILLSHETSAKEALKHTGALHAALFQAFPFTTKKQN